MAEAQYIVLGAGVIGLTTALELKTRQPQAEVIILAKHFPGDLSLEYTSPWAGANWLSVATDNGRQESWDAVTYKKFGHLADNVPEASVWRMPIRAIFDSTPEKAAVLSKDTGKIWYDKMVGGIRPVTKENGLPEGAGFGFEIDTFVLDTGAYLPWLQAECLKAGITFRRKILTDIKEPFQWFPSARAIFNCTALGSYHLLGVEDHALYPTLGQVMLVESPAVPIGKMYFRSPARTHSDTTYVFPRGDNRGVILGGCRIDGVWEGKVEEERAEDIKRRCCELCPALGKPEDLKVIKHGLGLRPSRKGGARIQKEVIGGRTVVHNYGAGGAGYQASWGMAKEAVNLLLQVAKL